MNVKRIVTVVILVLAGYFIGTSIFNNNPERIVIFENGSKNDSQNSMQIVPAVWNDNEDIPPSVNLFNETFVSIAKNVSPAVVTITAEKVIENRRPSFPGFDDDFFSRFFGLPEYEGKTKSTALGSGVIVDEKGYILTNNHVVENGEKIQVELMDERTYEAEIIGTDPRSDLAVIKIDADKLYPVVLGSSEELRIGEWVVAIGSPLHTNLAHTVTAGIVSGKGRNNIIGQNKIESFIQTDAAINPGNSGGALVNIKGELIGINTAIATQGGRAGNIGIGFAIPISLAKKVMQDLIEEGRVIRAWLGVNIQDIDDRNAKAMKLKTRKGVLIGGIVDDSPAEKAGIELGDVIVEFNGTEVRDASHLQILVGNSDVGDTKKVQVIRGRKERELKVKLEEFPENLDDISSSATDFSTSKYLGIRVEDITKSIAREYNCDPNEEGVIITYIERKSEAAGALRPGDIIKRIADMTIKSVSDFEDAFKEVDEEYILILVKRGNNTFFITLQNPE